MADKERDAMLREMAQHRGFRLVKSRRRKAGGDFGMYGLTEVKSGRECLGFGAEGLTATDAEVEAYLRSGERATWKRSLIGAVASAEVPAPKPKAKAAPEPKPEPKAKPEPSPKPDPAPEPEPEPAPELVIRKAAKSDAAAIAALIGGDAEQVGAQLASLLQAKDPVLVAVRGAILGCAAAHAVPRLDGPPVGRVTLLVVADEARMQGIGAALVAAAERALAGQGCGEIEVMSAIDISNAHGFFRHAGYERTSYRFHKAVAG
jgi:N-acetylglutamate synthase-like GNAT family acetyltransferase